MFVSFMIPSFSFSPLSFAVVHPRSSFTDPRSLSFTSIILVHNPRSLSSLVHFRSRALVHSGAACGVCNRVRAAACGVRA
eukprot:gene11470-biopygen7227